MTQQLDELRERLVRASEAIPDAAAGARQRIEARAGRLRRHRAIVVTRRAGVALLVGVVAVVVVVVRVAPGTPRHPNEHGETTLPTPSSVAGFPAALSHLVIVADLASGYSGGASFVAIDAGTGRSIPIGSFATSGSVVPPTGAAVVGGGVVVVQLPLQPGQDDIGTAVALMPGQATTRDLGPATYVFAGEQPGSVWIQEGNLDQECSLREVTVSGTTLHPLHRIPCSWTLRAVDGSSLVVNVYPGGTYVDTLDLWDPATGRLTALSTSVSAYPGSSVAGGMLASPIGGDPCTATCRFATGELAPGAFHTVTLSAAPGMYFPFGLQTSYGLSPDGRFIAVEEVPPATRAREQNQAVDAGLTCINSCEFPGNGVLAVYDAATGALVDERAMSFLNGEKPPVWSPDGTYLFVAATARVMAAVPALSPSAPITPYPVTLANGRAAVVTHFAVASLP